MGWLIWISLTCILSYIGMTLYSSNTEKHDLEKRLVVLETKVMILLEERSKILIDKDK